MDVSVGEKNNLTYGVFSAENDVPVEKALEPESHNNLFKIVIVAIVSALVFVGLLFLGFYIYSHFKSPDITLIAPDKESVKKTERSPFAGLTVSGSTVGAILADNEFVDEVSGFEIKSPAGWYLDDSRKTGAAVVFLSPETNLNNTNIFATFVSVTVGEAKGVLLKDQIVTVKNNILESFPDYSLEDDKEVYLQGRIYHLISGYYTTNGVKMRNRNMIVIYRDMGYAISATGPDETWAANELTIVTSMNSFGFI